MFEGYSFKERGKWVLKKDYFLLNHHWHTLWIKNCQSLFLHKNQI